MSAQYAFRAQKTLGLAESPSWEVSSQVPAETSAAKCSAYSPDGAWFAYASGSSVRLLPSASTSTQAARDISQPGVLALAFSPSSTYLFTFERPVKSETDVHRNVKAWSVESGEEVGGWHEKNFNDWVPVITSDETHLFRSTSSDLLIFTPPLAPRPATRLKGTGQIKGLFLSDPTELAEGTSSAKPIKAHSEPALAVWIGEQKGAPAAIALYPVSTLVGAGAADTEKTDTRDMPLTQARKAFYKSDKLTLKWNNAGTTALFMTQSDVDNTGKSYYGETNLYLISLDGSTSELVGLDKEGPIYDFVWNPTSREFSVCYGYMPAQVQMYDLKAKPIHSFGAQHRNFLSYQPQGRLLLTAGFGNLAGGVDIWEVSTRKKVAEFNASNASHCEWSPDGRFILTATLSPRLRVDNGVKICWCGGQLLHIHLQEELYQAAFQPGKLVNTPSFPSVLPSAPEPNPSVALHRPKGETSSGGDSKPAGAYRPPGARGTVASDAYRRDDSNPSSGASTPMFKGGKPPGRYIPGAPIPGAPAASSSNDGPKSKKKNNKKKADKENGNGNGTATPLVQEMANVDLNASSAPAADDANAKKIRNVEKKLKSIDELKARVAKGETLEKTQLTKIENEGQLRDELKALQA